MQVSATFSSHLFFRQHYVSTRHISPGTPGPSPLAVPPTSYASHCPPPLQGYLSHLGDSAITQQLLHRMRSATNMTDEIAALALLDRAGGQAGRGREGGRSRFCGAKPGAACARRCFALPMLARISVGFDLAKHSLPFKPPLRAIVGAGGEARATALAEFYKKWQKEPLVILKWVAIQVRAGEGCKGARAAGSPANQVCSWRRCFHCSSVPSETLVPVVCCVYDWVFTSSRYC